MNSSISGLSSTTVTLAAGAERHDRVGAAAGADDERVGVRWKLKDSAR